MSEAPVVPVVAETVTPPAPIWIDRILKGEITTTLVSEFTSELRKLKRYPIVIYLNSQGGGLLAGKALVDYLNSLDVPVTFISEISVGSMGTEIPHAHDFIRLCYSHTLFTVHGSSMYYTGNPQEIESQIAWSAEIDEYWNSTTMEAAGLTKKEYTKLTAFDNNFYGYKALQIGTKGYVDGLILKDNADGTFLIQTREGKKLIDVTKHRRSDLKDIPVIVEDEK